MEFVIVLILACGVFIFCFVVFLFKGRHSDEPPKLHACGQGEDCRCHGKTTKGNEFDLMEILKKAKRESTKD